MIKELSVLSQRFNDFFNQCQTAKLSVFHNRFCVAKESLAAWPFTASLQDYFFDCSRVLEYSKIRTVLQSHPVLNGLSTFVP